MQLNISCPINDTGYGIYASNIIVQLSKMGYDLSIVPYSIVSVPRHFKNEEKENILKCVQKALFFPYDAPHLNIYHQHYLFMHIGRGKYITQSFFELSPLSKLEKHHLGFPDVVCVPTHWAKSVLEEANIRPKESVYVCPAGVDTDMFCPIEPTLKQNTIFLNVGKWEIRKGHDVLLKCFNQAFEKNDNVELWICADNPIIPSNVRHGWHNFYMTSKLGKAGKIKLVNWLPSVIDVMNLMNQAHCGVFPARAEGWNLELLEMMALGKHVIATDYSGHTEYCSEDNAHLIKLSKTEQAHDGVFFLNEEGNWAVFDGDGEEQLIEHLRSVHQKVQSGNLINNEGIKTAQKYSWQNAAKALTLAING